MDATAWTVVGAAVAVLVAIGTSFRSLRGEMHAQGKDLLALREDLRQRIDAQGEGLRQRIDAQGEGLRQRIDAQGEGLRQRIDAQGEDLRQQMGLLRERMAHLEGLLEGIREAITSKRVA